jgi:DNA-directed RNA polymerase subunit RPC12/RpoP
MKYTKEDMISIETIGISFWGTDKDISPRHYCEDGTLGLLTEEYECLYCGEEISEKDKFLLKRLEPNYEMQTFYSYNTLGFSSNDKLTERYVHIKEEDATPIADKMIVNKYGNHIFHFCNGYHIELGKYFYEELGGINKDYVCYKCGYKLNKNERFLVKTLEFKENVKLYGYVYKD